MAEHAPDEAGEEGLEGGRLTAKQERFCREYLLDFNATQAYIRAGYAPKSADTCAARLLGNARVQRYLSKLKADAVKRAEVSLDAVIAQVARLAFSDIRSLYGEAGNCSLRTVPELDDEIAAAVQSVKLSTRRSGETDIDGRPVYEPVVEYKLADKRAALDMLGKYLGLWEGASGGTTDIADALRDLAERLPN